MNTKQKTDKGDVVQRLSDIEVQEVSMVDKGANRKKWAFVKSAGSVAETQALVDRYQAAKQGDEEALIGILKELLQQLSPEVLAKLGLQLLETAAPAEGEGASEDGAAAAPEGEMEMQAAAQKAAEEMAEKVRVLEERLQKAQDELAQAKVALGKVGEPQSGREPRGGSAEVVKADGDVRTLGMRPLNK